MHAILTTNRKLLIFVYLSLIALSLVVFSGRSYAQEETADSPEAETVEAFDTYTVVEGDNLTELVRRSLMEYDKSNDNIKLSNAQIVFAETNIVQGLDYGDLLIIGQDVMVSMASIEDFAIKSQELTADEIANWDVYANTVNFVLASRTPSDKSTSSDGTGQGSADNTDTEDIADDKSEDKNDSVATQKDEDEKVSSSSNWFWWIIGGGAVVIGWRMLGKSKEA